MLLSYTANWREKILQNVVKRGSMSLVKCTPLASSTGLHGTCRQEDYIDVILNEMTYAQARTCVCEPSRSATELGKIVQ